MPIPASPREQLYPNSEPAQAKEAVATPEYQVQGGICWGQLQNSQALFGKGFPLCRFYYMLGEPFLICCHGNNGTGRRCTAKHATTPSCMPSSSPVPWRRHDRVDRNLSIPKPHFPSGRKLVVAMRSGALGGGVLHHRTRTGPPFLGPVARGLFCQERGKG